MCTYDMEEIPKPSKMKIVVIVDGESNYYFCITKAIATKGDDRDGNVDIKMRSDYRVAGGCGRTRACRLTKKCQIIITSWQIESPYVATEIRSAVTPKCEYLSTGAIQFQQGRRGGTASLRLRVHGAPG